MTKHYVVLEFEQLHDGNLDNMPWADVLEGAVKVTNWRQITPEKIQDEAIDLAIGTVFSDVGDKTSQDVYENLWPDSENDELPEDLMLCEQYEYETLESARELVDGFVGVFTYHTRQLLQMEL